MLASYFSFLLSHHRPRITRFRLLCWFACLYGCWAALTIRAYGRDPGASAGTRGGYSQGFVQDPNDVSNPKR